MDLKELRQTMERHYQPKKLVLAERFGLMSKVQKPGQALHEYYAELQKAANTCSFEETRSSIREFLLVSRQRQQSSSG